MTQRPKLRIAMKPAFSVVLLFAVSACRTDQSSQGKAVEDIVSVANTNGEVKVVCRDGRSHTMSIGAFRTSVANNTICGSTSQSYVCSPRNGKFAIVNAHNQTVIIGENFDTIRNCQDRLETITNNIVCRRIDDKFFHVQLSQNLPLPGFGHPNNESCLNRARTVNEGLICLRQREDDAWHMVRIRDLQLIIGRGWTDGSGGCIERVQAISNGLTCRVVNGEIFRVDTNTNGIVSSAFPTVGACLVSTGSGAPTGTMYTNTQCRTRRGSGQYGPELNLDSNCQSLDTETRVGAVSVSGNCHNFLPFGTYARGACMHYKSIVNPNIVVYYSFDNCKAHSVRATIDMNTDCESVRDLSGNGTRPSFMYKNQCHRQREHIREICEKYKSGDL